MRDLINILDNLVFEARGLSARNPGDAFVRTGSSDDQDKIVFQGMQFYPDLHLHTGDELVVGNVKISVTSSGTFDQIVVTKIE